ncbi:VWA domain-containing protein [Alphaproteobacteria bacterium]|nr:VWA domain-containing protein [Alphaproteobacteria bacterium]
MANGNKNVPSKAGSQDVSDFLERLAMTPAVRSADGGGRLVFGMDATASREPTWDSACHIQGEMFKSTDGLGGLEVQLVYFRGFGECKSSVWVDSSDALVRSMTAVRCLGGRTQIGKILRHTMRETKKRKVNALVFVGDCIEEDVDELCHYAGQLGVLGVPMFVFQEGNDVAAMQAFRQFGRLTNGAYCRFDASSADQLRELLAAVAVYAAGGLRALEDLGNRGGSAVAQITSQLK